MLAFVTLAILLTMALALIRALRGPTVFDRILAVSMVSTKTTLLIAALGFLFGRPDFLDIALLYALINFVGAIAVLVAAPFLGVAALNFMAAALILAARKPSRPSLRSLREATQDEQDRQVG